MKNSNDKSDRKVASHVSTGRGLVNGAGVNTGLSSHSSARKSTDDLGMGDGRGNVPSGFKRQKMGRGTYLK